MAGPFSEEIVGSNGPGQLANLKRAGYMSPQDSSFTGEGFACRKCDWFSYRDNRCLHPAINAVVEPDGCSNLFTYHGVHT